MPTAVELMTPAIPRARREDTAGTVLETLRKHPPEEAGHIYLLDGGGRLIGQVPIEALLAAEASAELVKLQGAPPVEVRPEDSAETVALRAVERHDADVAVVDPERRLLGAIPIGRLLAQLHEEHVDDLLRLAGVGAGHPVLTQHNGVWTAFRARMPWLAIGLAGGMAAGAVAGLFEASFQQEITLAFFLPLVVYMADAVGTQTETVLVRALAYGRVPLLAQLIHEGRVGLLLGATIGTLAGMGLLVWVGGTLVTAVVAVSLALTILIATLVASVLPWGLARIGADPALASGPIATVIQDLLSVAVYLGIAAWLLG